MANLNIKPTEVFQSFQTIAHSLINNYHLQVNDTSIHLCDLEFYWNDGAGHSDPSTHEHKYLNGQLRPHGSGYDIALRNGNSYGGILIRGVMVDGEPTYGPLLSSDVIFKAGGNLFSEGFSAQLRKRVVRGDYKIVETTRVGLKSVEGNWHEKAYRFLTTNPAYLKVIKPKEAICLGIGEQYPELKHDMLNVIGYTPKKWR